MKKRDKGGVMASKFICFGFHEIELTNTDKILFPKAELTKGVLIDYYARIGDILLRYAKDRCISMHRFPNGVGTEGFYQKDAEDYFPEWVKRFPVKHTGKTVNYVVAENVATLVYLANLATVPHLWLSKISDIQKPDRLIFDIDPPEDKGFGPIRKAAFELKAVLEDELGLTPFVMTTGSRGLHVTVPIKPELDFKTVKAFAKDVASLLVLRHPKKYTVELRKAKRGTRIFLDTLRNEFGQTAVAPYAVRFKEGAPIDTPPNWDELVKKIKSSKHYTLKNIFRRLGRTEDPWKEIDKHERSIKKAQTKLKKLLAEVEKQQK